MKEKQARIGVDIHRGEVKPEWIDFNDHMNVAYYVLAFDYGVDALWDALGMDADYIRERRNSTFAVESHVRYLKEIRSGEPYVVTTQLLAFDDKRVHQFQRLYHADAGYLSATAEWLNLHVDMDTRRVSPWPDDVLENMRRFAERQGQIAHPVAAGQRIVIRKPLWGDADQNPGG